MVSLLIQSRAISLISLFNYEKCRYIVEINVIGTHLWHIISIYHTNSYYTMAIIRQ